MTTAAIRRVTKLEGALQPREAVLAWLIEAQQFPSLVDHARSIAALPVVAAPLSVIGQRIEAAVRDELKGQPRDVVWDAVRRSVGDGAFLFSLVVQVNGQAFEMARVEGLRATAAFYWMGCLLGGPRADDLSPAENKVYVDELAACWASWRLVIDRLSLDVRVENEARARLEERFFAGCEVFFPDVAKAWTDHVEFVGRLVGLADALTPGKPTARRLARTDSESTASIEELVANRAATLADDARVRAFEIMGERERAVAIMERRLLAD